MYPHLARSARRLPPDRFTAGRQMTWVLGCVVAIVTVGCPLVGPIPGSAASGIPTATLDGIMADPEGMGARVQLLVTGIFHYMVQAHPGGIVVTMDGVAASSASYHVSAGPVTGIEVRPLGDHSSLVDILVTTRTPLDVVESFLAERALVIRLAPPGTAARSGLPHPGPGAPGSSRAGLIPPHMEDQAAEETAGRTLPVLAGRRVVERTIRLAAGAGQVMQIDGLWRVAVSDPRVLGAVPVSSRELLVTGRTPGRTTMYVWEGAGRLLAYTVEVVPDADRIAGLRRLLDSLFTHAAITVTEVPADPARRDGGTASAIAAPAIAPPYAGRPAVESSGAVPSGVPHVPGSGGGAPAAALPPATAPQMAAPYQPAAVPAGPQAAIVLSGAVETQLDRQKVEEITRVFSAAVVNLLTVRRPVQLKLQVHVVELSHSALRTLGVTWGGGQQTAGAPPSLNGGVYNLQVITAPGLTTAGLDLLIAQIQALTQQGQARLLAEPSLVVLAGRTASLLLGGQVPIPVAGPNGSVAIEYRDFGVILNARPDYQEDGRVFMQISPEVSTLDFANAIKVSGFTIPALRVRRAQTVVSMLPTETLVIGGLLQQQDADLVQKVPVLGDLPIIGPLFRSTSFQRQETDLVIFVTPVLVGPNGGATPPTTP